MPLHFRSWDKSGWR